MKGMRRRPSPENLVTVAVLAAAVVFVFVQLQPHLLFRNNTPAGGDMGAHVWGPAFLRDHLLPHGRLSGWAPDWYAGFPALTFYFPLPSLLIVALDVVLPYGVAFKLVTALGLLALPVAAWAFGRLSGMRFPGPVLFGIATLPFMFDRFHTIYGGNVPATMAGEFAFSISLAVGLVFLGVLARGLETGRLIAAECGRQMKRYSMELGSKNVTIVMPEFIVYRWWQNLFHRQTALVLKRRLLFEPSVAAVTSVPYRLHS